MKEFDWPALILQCRSVEGPEPEQTRKELVDVLVGARLRGLRIKHGVLVADAASACGVSSALILKYEAGEVPLGMDRLKQFAYFLKVKIALFNP